MTGKPPWTPTVSVIGVGETGTETIRSIDTQTSINRYTANSTPELEACFKDVQENDFLFLSADLSEPDVENRVRELLHRNQGISILFAEGLTQLPEIIDEVNLLVPIQLEMLPQSIISATLADVFEAMMPMTVHDLGHGNITTFAGKGLVAELFIDTPRNKSPYPLTSLRNCENPESVLLFLCSGEKQPVEKIHSKFEEHSFPDEVSVLWDQRIHSRYMGNPHFKHFVTYQGLEDNLDWKETDYRSEEGSSTNIEESRFFSRKKED